MIEWSERLLVGDDAIDHQHRRVFEFSNSLEEKLQRGDTKTILAEGLGFLQTYIEIHFGAEERCMFRNACPMADQNRRAHGAFVTRFERLKADLAVTTQPRDVLVQFHSDLERWIEDHIVQVDLSLRECLEGSKPPPQKS